MHLNSKRKRSQFNCSLNRSEETRLCLLRLKVKNCRKIASRTLNCNESELVDVKENYEEHQEL